MKAFSFIGRSGSGKTRLISRLVPELRKRGFAIGVIKHCPHGFSLDREDTDSRRFFEAGASSVGLISPRVTAVIQRSKKSPGFQAFAERHFQGIDILLIEGGRSRKGIPKIEVLGEGEKPWPDGKAAERIAFVCDQGEARGRPVFRHSQVRQMAEFLEGRSERTVGTDHLSQDLRRKKA
jgi:molybdopterin-guanine dinucleotide biosynthesis protein MobB